MTNYGLVVPTYQPILDAGRTAPELVDTAVAAEELGLDSVWVGDTLARAPCGGPPVWPAAYTPGAPSRIGRLYDGWLPYPPDPADYVSGLARIRSLASRPVTPALFATVLVEDDVPRGQELLEDYCLT